MPETHLSGKKLLTVWQFLTFCSNWIDLFLFEYRVAQRSLVHTQCTPCKYKIQSFYPISKVVYNLVVAPRQTDGYPPPLPPKKKDIKTNY